MVVVARTLASIALAIALLAGASARADVQKFGKPLGDAPKVALAELVKNPDAWAGKSVKTEGKVSAACTAKGCWMTLAEGGKSVRVTFKDYGFFVPKDSAGTTAVLEGTFAVKTIPEATAKHYASETPGGQPDKIAGDQKEL